MSRYHKLSLNKCDIHAAFDNERIYHSPILYKGFGCKAPGAPQPTSAMKHKAEVFLWSTEWET